MLRIIETTSQTSASAKCYDNKIKNDPELYAKEKKRVMECMKNRHATDEEYSKRIQEQKKQSYYRRKALASQRIYIETNSSLIFPLSLKIDLRISR